jgi:hypothetical protein
MNENPDIASEKSLKRSVLIVAAFAAFLTPFLGSAVNLALPAIGRDLNASAIGLGWVKAVLFSHRQCFFFPSGGWLTLLAEKKSFRLESFYSQFQLLLLSLPGTSLFL